MKTRFAILSPPVGRSRRSALHATASGLTLMEMMVAMGLLSVIVLGLTAMLMQTQKAFKSGLKQVDVYEGGRAIMDMVARDFEQSADGQTLAPNVPLTNAWFGKVSTTTSNVMAVTGSTNSWTNEIWDVYSVQRISNQWFGVGYSVSNMFNSASGVSVGTLFRYSSNAPLSGATNLFNNFSNGVATLYSATPLNSANFHRMADGVVHFSIRAYDKDGCPVTNATPFVSFPCLYKNYLGNQNANSLPTYLEVELGILEPQTLEQLRSMPSAAQYNYLTNQLSKIHIFRQQIPIPAASR